MKDLTLSILSKVLFSIVPLYGNILLLIPGSLCFGVSGYMADTSPQEQISMLLWVGVIPVVIAIINVMALMAQKRLEARPGIVYVVLASCGNLYLMGMVMQDILHDSRGIDQLKDPVTLIITMIYILIPTTTITTLWLPVPPGQKSK